MGEDIQGPWLDRRTGRTVMVRDMIMDGDTPNTAYKVSQTTLFNAGIIAAILPFMILYPFLQKYFVGGMPLGAVKD